MPPAAAVSGSGGIRFGRKSNEYGDAEEVDARDVTDGKNNSSVENIVMAGMVPLWGFHTGPVMIRGRSHRVSGSLPADGSAAFRSADFHCRLPWPLLFDWFFIRYIIKFNNKMFKYFKKLKNILTSFFK